MKRVFSIFLLICIIGIAFGCSNQKAKVTDAGKTEAEVPQKYSEVLGAIPEEELSYLGAHFCLKAGGGSWRCEQAKLGEESHRHYELSSEEEFLALMIVHDERPVSEYALTRTPLAGHGSYKHPYVKGTGTEDITANPLPIEYKGKKLYVLEPDYSQVDRTPEAFGYYFKMNTPDRSGWNVLTPGFDFKK